MKRSFVITLAAAACMAAVVCCRKPVVRCDYQLTVTWQERKAEKTPLPLETATAYAFFVDPAQWMVASVEDAREGIITAVGDPSVKRTYDMVGLRGGEGRNVFSFEFDTEPVMLLVADSRYPMWATGNANVVPDLGNMYVTLNFAPLDWKKDDPEPAVKNQWKFYGYQNVKIPIDSELKIVASVRRVGEVKSQRLVSAQCYAFYGMVRDSGRVISWQQALAGIAEKLLKKPEGEENTEDEYEDVKYNVRGEWSDDTLRVRITDPKVMVVVYNQTSDPEETKMYAYGFFDFTNNPYHTETNLQFDLNKSGNSWYSDPWNMFLERSRVEE